MNLSRKLKKGEDYVNLYEIHSLFHEFITPGCEYGLDKQIQSTDSADNKDFKRGAMWGIAMYLVYLTSEAPKYQLDNSPVSEVIKEASKDICRKVELEVKEEKRKFGHKNIRVRKKLNMIRRKRYNVRRIQSGSFAW